MKKRNLDGAQTAKEWEDQKANTSKDTGYTPINDPAPGSEKFVAFSGGADSTALALLEQDAQPVFTDTNWEYDIIYEHIKNFEKQTGRKVIRIAHPDYPGGLPEYIKTSKFLPGHSARYCTRIFKIEAYNLFIKKHLPAELLIGLRADEDADNRIGNLTEMKGLNIRYPLREKGLNRMDVIKICIEHNLLPRYPEYTARGGCKGCFYKRKAEVRAMINLTPGVANELQELEESVQDKRGKFAVMFPNTGMSIREMKKQRELFTAEEVYQSATQDSDKAAACGLFCHR